MLSNGVRLFLGAHFQLSEKKRYSFNYPFRGMLLIDWSYGFRRCFNFTNRLKFRDFCIPPTEGRRYFAPENFHPFS